MQYIYRLNQVQHIESQRITPDLQSRLPIWQSPVSVKQLNRADEVDTIVKLNFFPKATHSLAVLSIGLQYRN